MERIINYILIKDFISTTELKQKNIKWRKFLNVKYGLVESTENK